MGLPNATSIISTLPGGMRVVVTRVDDGLVASLAVRSAIHESGQLSLGGLEPKAITNVWTIVADFTPRIRVGDTLTVGAIPSFVVDAMTSCGDLVSRAQVVLCEDTVTVGDRDIACHLGLLAEDIVASLGGFSPEDAQGFFVPESILPDGVEIVTSSMITIHGIRFSVEGISRSSRHGVLCVTCRRRGET